MTLGAPILESSVAFKHHQNSTRRRTPSRRCPKRQTWMFWMECTRCSCSRCARQSLTICRTRTTQRRESVAQICTMCAQVCGCITPCDLTECTNAQGHAAWTLMENNTLECNCQSVRSKGGARLRVSFTARPSALFEM